MTEKKETKSSPKPRKPRKTLTIGATNDAEGQDELALSGATTKPSETKQRMLPDEDDEATLIENTRPNLTDRSQNKYLQYGFSISVAFGIGMAIVGLFDSVPVALGVAGPLLAIVAFFVFGIFMGFGKHTDTRQQFADSCYFLGFLLTMIAMLVGFMPAGLFGSEITSQGILRHFSMALGATALGLIFRIWILQGGRPLDQLTAEIETDLLVYAREVSDEAKSISRELFATREELAAHRIEVANLVSEDLKNSVEEAFAPLKQAATATTMHLVKQTNLISEAADSLQLALNQAGSHIETSKAIQNDAETSVKEAGQSIGMALSSFAEAITNLRTDLVGIGGNTGQEIRQLTNAFSMGVKAAPELLAVSAELRQTMDETNANLKHISSESAAFAEQMNADLSENGRLLASLAATQMSVTEVVQSAGTTAAEAINASTKEATLELEESRDAFKAMISGESEATLHAIASTAAEFNAGLAVTANNLAGILADFSTKIDQAKAIKQ